MVSGWKASLKWVSNLQGGVVPQEEHFLHSTGIFPVALRRFRAVTASRVVATRRYKFRRGKTRLWRDVVTRFTKPLAAFFSRKDLSPSPHWYRIHCSHIYDWKWGKAHRYVSLSQDQKLLRNSPIRMYLLRQCNCTIPVRRRYLCYHHDVVSISARNIYSLYILCNVPNFRFNDCHGRPRWINMRHIYWLGLRICESYLFVQVVLLIDTMSFLYSPPRSAVSRCTPGLVHL